MEAYGPLLVVAMVVAIAAALFTFYRMERLRREALEATAHRLGLSYVAEADPLHQRRLGGFELATRGRGQSVSSWMTGRHGDLGVSLFDHRYRTGGGKHQKVWRQTVLLLEPPDLRLPVFALQPETLFRKLGAWLGGQDIDFDTHPAFSAAYLLRGPDEAAVRRLFTPAVLAWLEDHPGLSAESAGNRLLVYRHDQRVAPDQLPSFLEEGKDLLARLRPMPFF